jgi:hypothetical protein
VSSNLTLSARSLWAAPRSGRGSFLVLTGEEEQQDSELRACQNSGGYFRAAWAFRNASCLLRTAKEPVVLEPGAPAPKALFEFPVVLALRAFYPDAVLSAPVVLVSSAS